MHQQKTEELSLQYAAWDILEDERKVTTALLPNTAFNQKWKSYYRRLLFKAPYMEHDVQIFKNDSS